MKKKMSSGSNAGASELTTPLAAEGRGQRAEAGEFRRVATEAIGVGGTNPRRRFVLDDLLASIPVHGIVQPLVVRPLPRFTLLEPDLISDKWRLMQEGMSAEETPTLVAEFGQENLAHMERNARNQHEFELVAGERRWRAAKKLGLAEVPVMVQRLDDREAWEVQQIENLNRADLTPLEEAQGFAEIIAKKIYGESQRESVVTLAETLGKSVSHIYGRLALLKLSPLVRTALDEGKIEHCIAVEISKVPGEKAQQALLKEAMGSEQHEAMSVRDVRWEIERHYVKSLEKAPFDVEDETLTTAGACANCPKRTGNMLDVYPDLKSRPNDCTEPKCFEAKQQAAAEAKLAKAHSQGCKVVEPGSAEHKELFKYSNDARYVPDAAYVAANSMCPNDPKERTLGQVLKGVKPVVTVAPNGDTVKLYPKAELPKLLEQAGLKFAKPGPKKKSAEELKDEFDAAVNVAVAKWIIADVQDGATMDQALRGLVVGHDNGAAYQEILERRGIVVGTQGVGQAIQSMGARELASLLMEEAMFWGEDKVNRHFLANVEAVWKGLNRKDIEKQVKCDIAAKEQKQKAEEKKGVATKDAKGTKKKKGKK